MNKFLVEIIRNLTIVFFPFLIYYFFSFINTMESSSSNILNYFSGGLFYIYSIISIFYFILVQTEKITEYLTKKLNTIEFLINIVALIIFISLSYATFYWCIYDFNNETFNNVMGNNFIEIYFDFFYYSLGVFLVNNNSQIQAATYYSQIFTMTEMISTFIVIIIIFSNYKNLNFKNKPKKS